MRKANIILVFGLQSSMLNYVIAIFGFLNTMN